MTREEAIILAAALLGIPFCTCNLNKLNIWLDRTELLKNISDDIFIDSSTIKKKKEEIKNNLNFTNPNNLIKDHFALFEKKFF